MKSLLLAVFLRLPVLSFTQISFEHVSSPNDFSIGVVRKSPVGEYFVQASIDFKSIYTSLDGIEWNRVPLPVEHELYDIQFFSDGTPVLKSEGDEHLIRRNGNYFTMDAGGGDFVEASFIKDDTLFIYHDNRFAYSLDKGQTFSTIFTYNGSLIDHTAQLWKFENHLVLHHTAGTQDRLSVFDMNGERVLSDTFNIFFSAAITYNSCGEILFTDEDSFYLLKEDLTYLIGPVHHIMPQYDYNTVILSNGGDYYWRNGNSIYKTDGCNFAWQFYSANDLIESTKFIWVNHLGEIFIYYPGNDYFTVETNGVQVEHFPDIHHPTINDVDESIQGDQFAITSNAMFRKHKDEEEWIELDTASGYFPIQYSPNGDLFINRTRDILYSKDNGENFSIIPNPPGQDPFYPEYMEVFGDGKLFVYGGDYGEGFYTLNYGQDWVNTHLSVELNAAKVVQVDSHIIVASLDINYQVSRININTLEVTTESLGDFLSVFTSNSALLNDGTLYFWNEYFGSAEPEGLYRYRFGEEVVFLGSFPQLEFFKLVSSGNNLYALGHNDYYIFEGAEFSTRKFLLGLPQDGFREYSIGQNEHLYAIVSNQNIFRSTEPLSMTIATNEVSDLIDFAVFPNPAYEKISVTGFEGDLDRIDSYEIINQLGQMINQSAFSDRQHINVSELTPGLYNLMLKESGVVVGMKKFVKF